MEEEIVEIETDDGYPLRYRSWQTGEADTLVAMQHGVLTHSGWFSELGDALLEAGVHVIGHDRRGSGLHTKDRGDIDGPDRLIADLDAVVRPQRGCYRHIVHFGWCLGATVGLHYLLRHPEMGEGLILTSPDIFEKHLRPAVRRVFSDAKWDDRILPRLGVPIPPEIYTGNRYLDAFIRPDPMKLEDVTPRFMRATLRLKENLEGHFAAFDKPSLLLLAGRDQIIDNEKTRELYLNVGSTSSEIVELDCQHGIQFEALPELVAEILGFVERLKVCGGGQMGRSASSVASLEVLPVRLRFKHSVGHARAARKASRPQIVRLCLEDGTVGYGEALPRPYVTGETEESVRSELSGALGRLVNGVELPSLEAVDAWLATEAVRQARDRAPAAFCGLELALLDAVGRRTGRSVAEVLGGSRRTELPYDGAVIGYLPEAALRLVLRRLAQLGPRVVKMKVGRPDDVDRLTTLRRVLGEGVELIVDANGVWSADEAIERVRELEGFGLAAVEQPVPGRDFEGLARVARAVETPLMADESLCSRADAERLLELDAARLWNLRIGKCGGLLGTLDLARRAAERGVQCQLGILIGESGLLTVAGRLLATCFEDFAYLEADGFGNLRDEVLVEPLPPVRRLRAPAPGLGPGLGVEVDRRGLESLVEVPDVRAASPPSWGGASRSRASASGGLGG